MVRFTTYHFRNQLVQRKQHKVNRTGLITTTQRKRQWTTIGQWNIRTLFQKGKLAQVNRELSRYQIDMLGLSEVRWTESGQIISPCGTMFLYSGHETEHSRGVGILLSKSIRDSLLEWEPISDRIIRARLSVKYGKLQIIQCYAPTEDKDLSLKEAFYSQLDQTLAKIPKQDMVILMGDFNAKVGSSNDNAEHVMGRHGLGTRNENGELLIDVCSSHNLVIGGTLFPHKDCHKVTWNSPNRRDRNQIDHICISQRWSKALLDVRNKRGADVGSDHHLVIGKLRFYFKRKKKTTNTRKKFCLTKLRAAEARSRFVSSLNAKVSNCNDTTMEGRWRHIRDSILSTCDAELGTTRKKSEEYIQERTWKTIDRRKEVYVKLLSATDANAEELCQQYSLLDRQVKREVRSDWRRHLNCLAEKAQASADCGNMKDLYNTIKELGGQSAKKQAPIKSKEGKVLVTLEEQLARWKEHFEEVLNVEREGICVEVVNNPPILRITTSSPSIKEITEAVKRLKNGKAAGNDGIPAEVLKADGNATAKMLKPLFDEIWSLEKYPEDWKEGLIVKLPKKGDLSSCGNWRGITLLSVVSKVFMSVILQRIMAPIETRLRKEQAGFRPYRSCIDQISTLRIIIEQSIEWQSALYLVFVDYEKAFDSINRECIWMELRNLGVPEKLIRLISEAYNGFRCKVLHEGVQSESFVSLTGVRQGDLLSPLLFLVIMDKVMRAATKNKPRGITWIQTERLEDLDYADDACLLAHTYQDMQAKINDLESESAKVGLVINIKKTEEIRVNAKNNRPLHIGNEIINRVEHFTYLGSNISADGGALKDVNMRIQKARGAFAKLLNVWKSTSITKHLKMKIFNACVKSVLLYGCETWFVTNEVKRKLQVYVNSCYRRILKIWWTGNPEDWPSNEKLLQKAGQQDINKEIQMRKYGWIGHTLRKKNTRENVNAGTETQVCYTALGWNPQGKRRPGAPKATWRRTVMKECQLNVRTENLYKLGDKASNKVRWKAFCCNLSST